MTPPPDPYLQAVNSIADRMRQEYQVHSTIIQNGDNGPLIILIENNTDNSITISKDQCIENIITHKLSKVALKVDGSIPTRRSKGIGKQSVTPIPTQDNVTVVEHNTSDKIGKTPMIIPFNMYEIGYDTEEGYGMNMHTQIEVPYQIALPSDPLNNKVDIKIATKDMHLTLDFNLQTNGQLGNRLQLIECIKLTPLARIPTWRSTMRNSFPSKVNDMEVNTKEDIKQCVKSVKTKSENLWYAHL